jgi:tRNA pseudouridine38-40 synthase
VNTPPERRLRLTLQYDGADYHGWQFQPGVRTVQSEVESVLSRLLDRRVTVVAAGRTDRGVHATGQVISLTAPSRWTPPALRRAANALLPPDIWIVAASEVAPTFHARFDAIARAYEYRVGTAPAARSPFRFRWCWPLMEVLEAAALNSAAETVVGEHAFGAFAKSGQPERGERCQVFGARWIRWGARGYTFRIVANRFLHHMVRYLVGTMVDVARGRRAAQDMADLLAGGPGLETSPPAPARGLFLTRVYYAPEEPGLEESTDEDLP